MISLTLPSLSLQRAQGKGVAGFVCQGSRGGRAEPRGNAEEPQKRLRRGDGDLRGGLWGSRGGGCEGLSGLVGIAAQLSSDLEEIIAFFRRIPWGCFRRSWRRREEGLSRLLRYLGVVEGAGGGKGSRRFADEHAALYCIHFCHTIVVNTVVNRQGPVYAGAGI